MNISKINLFSVQSSSPVFSGTVRAASLRIPSGDTFIKSSPRPGVRFGSDADEDLHRFEKIVDGQYREDLKQFINPQDKQIDEGGKRVRLPRHDISLPKFTRGDGEDGMGQGEGAEGDPVDGKPDPNGKPGKGAGEGEGNHEQEKWGPPITRSEIARMMMENLKLPNLQIKGSDMIPQDSIKWTNVSRKGSNVLIKRTIKEALERSMAEGKHVTVDKDGEVNIENLEVLPSDKRYRSWQDDVKPRANAVIFYAMDVSGSMGEEQKAICRTTNFYYSTVVNHQFGKANAELRGEEFTDENFGDGVKEVFIIFDSSAKQVPEKEFYETKEDGGTRLSSPVKLIQEMIKKEFPPEHWNIYINLYSDGDNMSTTDSGEACKMFDELMPDVNAIGYVQTASSYGSGAFYDFVRDRYSDKHPKVRISKVNDIRPDNIQRTLKALLEEREEGKAAA